MKRASERQITKDDPGNDSSDETDTQHTRQFDRAPPDVLAGRRIVKVRRSVPRSNGDSNPAPAANPFAALLNKPSAPAPTSTPTPPSALAPAPASKAPADSSVSGKEDAKPNHTSSEQPVAAEKEKDDDKGTENDKNGHGEEQAAAEDKDAKEAPTISSKLSSEDKTAENGAEPDRKASDTANTKTDGAKPAEGTDKTVKPSEGEGKGKCDDKPDEPKQSPGAVENKSSADDTDAKADAISDTQNGANAVANASAPDADKSASEEKVPDNKGAVEKTEKDDDKKAEEKGDVKNPTESNGASSVAEGGEGVAKKDATGADGGAASASKSLFGSGSGLFKSGFGAASGPGLFSSTTSGGADNPKRQRTATPFGGLGSSAPLTFAAAAAQDSGSTGGSLFGFKPADASTSTGNGNGTTDKSGSSNSADVSKNKWQSELKEEKVETGEEGEDEVFRSRAKLYVLEGKGAQARWRERGVGALKIKRNPQNGSARLLMRTEATLIVVLNSPLFPELIIDHASERSVRFQGFDDATRWGGDDEKGKEDKDNDDKNDEKDKADEGDKKAKNSNAGGDGASKNKCFLVRFATKDVVATFVRAIDDWKKSVKKNKL